MASVHGITPCCVEDLILYIPIFFEKRHNVKVDFQLVFLSLWWFVKQWFYVQSNNYDYNSLFYLILQVTVRSGEVHKSRYSKGLTVKYKYQNEQDYSSSPTVKDTLSPEWNYSRVISIPSVSQDHLDFFDSNSISFMLYGTQVESEADPRLAKLTTKVKWMSCSLTRVVRLMECYRQGWIQKFSKGESKHFYRSKTVVPGCAHTVRCPVSAKIKGHPPVSAK